MKISVAMVTYNGAAHLREQLDSIASQTRLPDELVVADDGSTDGTQALLRELPGQLPFPVRLHVGEHLGMWRNVENALQLATGDIIAMADQDDVWHPNKLAASEAALMASPKVGLVFSNAAVVDERLERRGYSVWQTIHFGAEEQSLIRAGRAFDVLTKRNVVQGCTMVFYSSYKDILVPMPVPMPIRRNTFPDGWIALLISCVADLAYIDQELVFYRQHSGQHLGASHSPVDTNHRMMTGAHNDPYKVTAYSATSAVWRELYDVFNRSASLNPRWAPAAHLMLSLALHREARDSLPGSLAARLPIVLRETTSLRYHRYSRGLLSAAKDTLGRSASDSTLQNPRPEEERN